MCIKYQLSITKYSFPMYPANINYLTPPILEPYIAPFIVDLMADGQARGVH